MEQRLPNNVNVCFEYIEGESMLLNLDLRGYSRLQRFRLYVGIP